MILFNRRIFIGRLAITSFLISVLVLSSCSKMRHLEDGEVYLKGQRVTTPQTLIVPLPFSHEDLLAFSRLKPNRKILGIRLNHAVYLMVNQKKLERDKIRTAEKCAKKNQQRRIKGKEEESCRCWREFWAYTVGEPSAILDTFKMKRSAEQMILHMQKRGYFDAEVIPSVNYNKDSSSCSVDYHLIAGEPYIISRIDFEINDPYILPLKSSVEQVGAIKTGMPLEVDMLNTARDKVTQLLNNEGFYDFTRDYIRFEVDTNSGRGAVSVVMQITEPEFADEQGNIFSTSHRKYYIGDVYVHTQFDATDPSYQPKDTSLFDNINILSNTRSEINPELISCLMAFGSDDIYQKKHVETTYRRFSKLGVFRSTSIKLVPRDVKSSDGRFLLDTHIQLTPARRQMFTIDPHMTNRSGNLGIYGNLQYTHKNVFRGAESLELRVVTGVEASRTLIETNNQDNAGREITRTFRLNTFEIGPEITYRIPKLFPLRCRSVSKSSEPNTSLSGAFNYQKRPDYERTLSQLRLSYNWIENPGRVSYFNIDLIEFSIIKIEKSDAFDQFLKRINDSFLANSYIDHLILASSVSYTINTQKSGFQRRYNYVRFYASGAGNALNGLVSLSEGTQAVGAPYEIFNIRYAQYFRGELDFRQYINANDRNGVAVRLYGGLGTPRKNAVALPFEKSFFSGGANGMRAWQARTLGPGSFRDSQNAETFNNIGELKLEGNAEYRFEFTDMFNLALFADAGNIWLLHPDEGRPFSEFNGKRFYKEIAFGGGLGARLNFDFFLVRLDLGVQLKDPAKVEGERWLWQPKSEYVSYLRSVGFNEDKIPFRSNLVLNLGIGLPF